MLVTVALLLGIAASPAMASNSIMDVLNTHSDRFMVLITAIQAAGLADTLTKGINTNLKCHSTLL